ncbi:MAG: TadE/TadG family type IV pilus assembly protein [Pirellulaceae bacterium]
MQFMQEPLANRRGATAVEFAIVAPIIFALFFSAIEVSGLMLAEGSLNSAMLVGMREASLTDSTPTKVRKAIRKELKKLGYSNISIGFTPSNFGPDDRELQISMQLPIDASNGFFGSSLVTPNARITKSIQVVRESN